MLKELSKEEWLKNHNKRIDDIITSYNPLQESIGLNSNKPYSYNANKNNE